MRIAADYLCRVGWMWLILAAATLQADELLVYSLTESQVNPALIQRLQEKTPQRDIIPLNGQWNLKNPATGAFLGNVRLPFAYRSRQRLNLEKQLTLRRESRDINWLHIGSVVGDLSVRWNDSLIYRGDRNYLPVSLPLPAAADQNENVIQLEIAGQNRRHGDLPGFYPINLPRIDYGILDGIYLEARPLRHLQQLDISAIYAGDTTFFGGTVTLSGALPDSLGYRLRLRCLDENTVIWKKDVSVTDSRTPHVTLPLVSRTGVQPWTPDNPHRLFVEVTLDSAGKNLDILREPIAVRSSAMTDNRFQWNHQPLVIEGVNYVYQSREGATLYEPELLRSDLLDIKARGFNAVRVVLHTMPEWFYRICDETGLLVFQDLPFVLWSKDHLAQQKTLSRWSGYQSYLAELANRYNCMAGVGLAFYPDLTDPAQRSRLDVVAESMKAQKNLPKYLVSLLPAGGISAHVDFQLVDILGRRLTARNMQRTAEQLAPQRFYPTAFSKAMTFRVDSSIIAEDLLLAQEFYRQLIQNALPAADKGNFIQTYSDFYLHLPSLQNGFQENYYLNRMGLVDIQRQPRNIEERRRQQVFATSSPVGMLREYRGTHSFIYILVGLLNIFVFLVTYKRYKVFRQSIAYSIKKPHGFFVSLQERIIIPNKQSFFILLVIALNGALIYSALFYYYRNHLLADYLLSLLFYTPQVKEKAVQLIWDQPLFIAVVTVLIVIFFYFQALVLKTISLLGRSRVLFNQALAVTIWSAVPFIFLLPLGVVMYSLLLMMKTYWIIFALLLYFHVWTYFRWMNGVRVLTDHLYSRVFLLLTIIMILTLTGFGYLYEAHYHVTQHLDYVRELQAFWK